MSTRILIYRVGAFGDTLLLSLLFKYLRANGENVRITLAANPRYAAPLFDSGLIHEILDGGAPPFHLLYDKHPPENDALFHLINSYDTCMFYSADISGELGKRLNSKRLEQCRIHPPFPPASEEIHICEWMMRPWPPLGARKARNMKLNPSQNNLILCNKLLKEYGLHDSNFFTLHPGGGGHNKWVPPEILTKIGRRHADKTGQLPVLVEGPADAVATEEFQRFWGDPIPIIRDVSPKVLSAIFSKSSAYIGGDSGVSHLASLYAPRATILHGPDSNMRAWHPIGFHTRYVPWETTW